VIVIPADNERIAADLGAVLKVLAGYRLGS
jgi:hypothetical protein